MTDEPTHLSLEEIRALSAEDAGKRWEEVQRSLEHHDQAPADDRPEVHGVDRIARAYADGGTGKRPATLPAEDPPKPAPAQRNQIGGRR